MRKAADWLISIQNADGGWGEDGTSYKLDYRRLRGRPEHRLANGLGPPRPDGGVVRPVTSAVTRGIDFLIRTQGHDGSVGGGAFHCNRISTGLLSAVSWLREAVSALGPGPAIGTLRRVSPSDTGCNAAALSTLSP